MGASAIRGTSWSPYYQGILLFGDLLLGLPYFRKPSCAVCLPGPAKVPSCWVARAALILGAQCEEQIFCIPQNQERCSRGRQQSWCEHPALSPGQFELRHFLANGLLQGTLGGRAVNNSSNLPARDSLVAAGARTKPPEPLEARTSSRHSCHHPGSPGDKTGETQSFASPSHPPKAQHVGRTVSDELPHFCDVDLRCQGLSIWLLTQPLHILKTP